MAAPIGGSLLTLAAMAVVDAPVNASAPAIAAARLMFRMLMRFSSFGLPRSGMSVPETNEPARLPFLPLRALKGLLVTEGEAEA